MLAEHVAKLRRRAVAVVRERVQKDRHAAGAVTLVRDLFVRDAGELAGTALDRPCARCRPAVGAFADTIAARRRGLPSASPATFAPAAVVSSRMILVKSLPRLASSLPFLCLIVLTCWWPDIKTPMGTGSPAPRELYTGAEHGKTYPLNPY